MKRFFFVVAAIGAILYISPPALVAVSGVVLLFAIWAFCDAYDDMRLQSKINARMKTAPRDFDDGPGADADTGMIEVTHVGSAAREFIKAPPAADMSENTPFRRDQNLAPSAGAILRLAQKRANYEKAKRAWRESMRQAKSKG